MNCFKRIRYQAKGGDPRKRVGEIKTGIEEMWGNALLWGRLGQVGAL